MNPSNLIIITGAKVFSNNGLSQVNLLIDEKGILKFIDSLPKDFKGKVYNANSYYVLPSFVDMHVHLREPGFDYKETIKTGTEAAAAGGFTTVCPMPNLKPAPDTIDNLNIQLGIIKNSAIVNVLPFATITKGRNGKELVDYQAMAPYVAGFSDDGSGVQSESIMKLAMQGIAKTGKLLAAHCEVESMINGGYIHDGIYAKMHNHKGINSESEWKEVERDIRLSEETGCRLHICHISTKESVELVRKAKKKGLKVTCETGPHYLTFNDEMIREHGRFKMNPPIRSKRDQEALIQGLIDGTIDVIATDHAPHSFDEKNRGLENSSMGVVGLETAFSAVYTKMVISGMMSIERLIEVMCNTPRKMLGLSEMPYIEDGKKANLVVLNPDETFTVNPDNFKSMGKSTPYEGMTLQGKIKMTIYNGNPVYNSL